jgi:adenosylcobyric acid synthase
MAAPFKSQNMALNSFITSDGLEMGRAQVVQAEAAGIEPDVDMNPVLLKPIGDSLSQVIVHGKIWADLNARDYYRFKQCLLPAVTESYERLSAKFDIIVLEGAGSPTEINLRDNDIVNMFMARLAFCPVLLVSDIDRGGVFASLAGTMLLFTEAERRYVKGFIINKFRGDKSLLDDGLRQIMEITGRPVLGVVPHFRLDIDDEDSLSERLESSGVSGEALEIAVVRLPHMSNYTDFSALSRLGGVSVRYCGSPADFGTASLIIIPGTKNTIRDLEWMRKNSIEVAIKKHAAVGKPVFGICGGYQMLGEVISDPYKVESGGSIEGIGLLPVSTVFESEKQRCRVSGKFLDIGGVLAGISKEEIEGYEVHMGVTTHCGGGCKALAKIKDSISGREFLDGAQSGSVYGSYIHGIFDAGSVAFLIAKALYNADGLKYDCAANTLSTEQYKETQYDALANILRDSIDMNAVYKILDGGMSDSTRGMI